MNPMPIDVLGTTYRIYELSPQDGGTPKSKTLGCTDWTTHEIMVKGSIKEPQGKEALAISDVL